MGHVDGVTAVCHLSDQPLAETGLYLQPGSRDAFQITATAYNKRHYLEWMRYYFQPGRPSTRGCINTRA